MVFTLQASAFVPHQAQSAVVSLVLIYLRKSPAIDDIAGKPAIEKFGLSHFLSVEILAFSETYLNLLLQFFESLKKIEVEVNDSNLPIKIRQNEFNLKNKNISDERKLKKSYSEKTKEHIY